MLPSPSTINDSTPPFLPLKSTPASSLAASIPPEILTQILEQGREPESSSSSSRSPTRDYQLLSSSSLVCRAWRDVSQRVLWNEVVVMREEQAWRLLASSLLGVYPTEGIWLSGSRHAVYGLEVKSAIGVISALKGVQQLRLSGFSEGVAELLLSSSLKDLRSLKLDETELGEKDAATPFPFSLSKLHLTKLSPRDGQQIVTLKSLGSSNLATLFVDDTVFSYDRFPFPIIAALLKESSANLVNLRFLPGSTHRSIRPLFPLFTSLRTLHLDFTLALPEILESLPSQISALHLSRFSDHRPKMVVSTIASLLSLPSLSKLTLLALHESPHPSFMLSDVKRVMSAEGAEDLVLDLRRRAIILEQLKHGDD